MLCGLLTIYENVNGFVLLKRCYSLAGMGKVRYMPISQYDPDDMTRDINSKW